MKYLTLITALLGTPLLAQDVANPTFLSKQPCAPMQEVAEIAMQSGETILFNGQILNQHITGQMVKAEFVFTVNQDTGSWTLVSLYPNGIACMVGNGTHFVPYTKNN